MPSVGGAKLRMVGDLDPLAVLELQTDPAEGVEGEARAGVSSAKAAMGVMYLCPPT
jgi:hypothetical protein